MMKKTTLFILSLLLSTVAGAEPPHAEEPKEKIPSQIAGSTPSLPASFDPYSPTPKASKSELNSSVGSEDDLKSKVGIYENIRSFFRMIISILEEIFYKTSKEDSPTKVNSSPEGLWTQDLSSSIDEDEFDNFEESAEVLTDAKIEELLKKEAQK